MVPLRRPESRRGQASLPLQFVQPDRQEFERSPEEEGWRARSHRCAILTTMQPDQLPDVSTFSETGLFSLYRDIMRELKSRGMIRTENAPVGDYAEYLVVVALGGQLAPNSEKSWDITSREGERLQVKARVVSDPPKSGQLQLSPFRSFDFDAAVIVLLSDTDYVVWRASKVPRSVVESVAIHRQYVNGKVLFARPEIMSHPDAKDMTATLRTIQTVDRKTS